MNVNYYVLRHRGPVASADRTSWAQPARWSWVGPIKGGLAQAQREVAAWVDAGWDASVYAPTVPVKAEVRRWDRLTLKAGYVPDFEAMGRGAA